MIVPKSSALSLLITGFVTLTLLIAGLGVWMVQARITGAVIATGTLEVESNRQIVQHPTGGVVRDIEARDGEHVEVGDVLLRLDTSQQQAELTFVQTQLFDLIARQNRLQAEGLRLNEVIFDPALLKQSNDDIALRALLDGQQQVFWATRLNVQAETSKLRSRKEQIAAQIEGIVAQRAAVMRQIEVNAGALANQRTLFARGLTPAGSVLELEREEARLGGTLGELNASHTAAQQRLIEMDEELDHVMSEHAEHGIARARDLDAPIRQFRRDAFVLQQEIAQSEIRAPVSGIVYGMAVHTRRAVLRPAEPVLYLIPQDRPLIVAIRIPPRHVDLVQQGQSVKLRLTALDQNDTPEVWGHVTRISADAIRDTTTGQSYFRAEVELPAFALNGLPAGIALMPGMPVEAYIRTGEHSPLAYLLKPMTDYFARALRES